VQPDAVAWQDFAGAHWRRAMSVSELDAGRAKVGALRPDGMRIPVTYEKPIESQGVAPSIAPIGFGC
jgi:hypothetical protein